MSEELDIVLGNMVRAISMLERSAEFAHLVPEVKVNLVYAPPDAGSPKEVAGVAGRITVVNGRPKAAGLPQLGASDHMARLVFEARSYDPNIAAGINFKCDEYIISVVRDYCREKSISFGWIDRTHEPPESAQEDGHSIPWKMAYLIKTYGHLPRIFYEGPALSKEPLFVALGKEATEVAGIALEIAARIA
jgi:hydroxymethylpyrimidine/phosphomethylpyrimidine kinase